MPLRIPSAPPTSNPTATSLPHSFLSLYNYRAQDSSSHLTKDISSWYILLDWRTVVPSPSLRKYLPVNELANLPLPLQERLSRFPLILYPHPPHQYAYPTCPAHATHLYRPPKERQSHASCRVDDSTPQTPLLHPFSQLLPTSHYGPGKVCGWQDLPNACGEKVSSPPLFRARSRRTKHLLQIPSTRGKPLACHPQMQYPPSPQGPPDNRSHVY